MASRNINDEFFAGVYQEAWRTLSPQGLTDAEVDLIVSECSLTSGSRVIDLLCGYGRHTVPIAKRGISVTCVDNLPNYIEEIKRTAEHYHIDVNAFCTSVLNMDDFGLHDSAICMGNSFAFFNREEAQTLLSKTASMLKGGGKLIINSWMIAEIALRHFRLRDWHQAGRYKCILEYTYQFHPSRIESEQTIVGEEGVIEILKGIDYIYSLDEIEQMFNYASLRTIGLYSTPKKRPFQLGDTQIYIVAEKV